MIDKLAHSEEACQSSAELLAGHWEAAIHLGLPINSGVDQWREKNGAEINAAKIAWEETESAMKDEAAARVAGEAHGLASQWFTAQASFCKTATAPEGYTLMAFRDAMRREKELADGMGARLRILQSQLGASATAGETAPSESAPPYQPSAAEFARKQAQWKKFQEEKERDEVAQARALADAEQSRIDAHKAENDTMAVRQELGRREEAAKQAEATARARRAWRNSYARSAPALSAAINNITQWGVAEPKYCEALAGATTAFSSGGPPPDPDLTGAYEEAVDRLGKAAEA